MQKLRFLKSEVLSFLESKIMDNIATYDEETLYQEYQWTGKLMKNFTYKKVISQMKKIYESGF